MDFDEINRILDIVRQHELSEFELEREGFKIRIKKGSLVHAMAPLAPPAPAAAPHGGPSAAPHRRPRPRPSPRRPQRRPTKPTSRS